MLPKLTHPTYDFEIPSSDKKIKIRPMLVKDEKILLTAKEGSDVTEIFNAIKQIVYNCMETQINESELTIFDIEYLFLKIRMISVSDNVKITITDNDEEIEIEINLNDVKIEFSNDKKNHQTVKIDKSKAIVLAWPSAKLYGDKNLMSEEITEVKMHDILFENCIEKYIDGEEIYLLENSTQEERREFIDNLDLKTSEKIMNFLDNMPRLHYETEYKTKDGNSKKLELSSLTDFFTF